MSTPHPLADDPRDPATSPADELPVLAAEAARLGIPLDARARARFGRYRRLLAEWNERAGLTTVSAPAEVERRHFGEALALLAALR